MASTLTRLTKTAGNGNAPAQTEIESANIRYSPKSVISQRERLGLSVADYGKLVGVSAVTIYGWAQGKSRPRSAQIRALAEVRGIGKREAAPKLEGATGCPHVTACPSLLPVCPSQRRQGFWRRTKFAHSALLGNRRRIDAPIAQECKSR